MLLNETQATNKYGDKLTLKEFFEQEIRKLNLTSEMKGSNVRVRLVTFSDKNSLASQMNSYDNITHYEVVAHGFTDDVGINYVYLPNATNMLRDDVTQMIRNSGCDGNLHSCTRNNTVQLHNALRNMKTTAQNKYNKAR